MSFDEGIQFAQGIRAPVPLNDDQIVALDRLLAEVPIDGAPKFFWYDWRTAVDGVASIEEPTLGTILRSSTGRNIGYIEWHDDRWTVWASSHWQVPSTLVYEGPRMGAMSGPIFV